MREILFRGKRKDSHEWVDGLPYASKYGNDVDTIMKADGECIPVIPETVGQYTGLKDQNRKKIFEGDIIRCSIEYDCGCYPHSETSYREVRIPDIYRVNIDGEIEVIGNIYDNPELLKG